MAPSWGCPWRQILRHSHDFVSIISLHGQCFLRSNIFYAMMCFSRCKSTYSPEKVSQFWRANKHRNCRGAQTHVARPKHFRPWSYVVIPQPRDKHARETLSRDFRDRKLERANGPFVHAGKVFTISGYQLRVHGAVPPVSAILLGFISRWNLYINSWIQSVHAYESVLNSAPTPRFCALPCYGILSERVKADEIGSLRLSGIASIIIVDRSMHLHYC